MFKTKTFWMAAVAAFSVFAFVPAANAANWTGFYGGLHSGYYGTSTEYENAGTPHQSMHGLMGGIQAGYDYQLENGIVLGVVGDLSTGDVKTDPIRDGNYIVEHGKVDFSGSLRARVGYAIDNFLPYVTGGVVWEKVEQSESCPHSSAVPFGFCHTHGGANGFDLSQTKTQTGWTLGAGLAYAIDQHWSLAGEYQYRHFGSVDYNLGLDGIGVPLPVSTMKSRNSDFVTIRINYKF